MKYALYLVRHIPQFRAESPRFVWIGDSSRAILEIQPKHHPSVTTPNKSKFEKETKPILDFPITVKKIGRDLIAILRPLIKYHPPPLALIYLGLTNFHFRQRCQPCQKPIVERIPSLRIELSLDFSVAGASSPGALQWNAFLPDK